MNMILRLLIANLLIIFTTMSQSTIVDKTLQYFGTIDELAQLRYDNNLSMQDPIPNDEDLVINNDGVGNETIKRFFEDTGIEPNNKRIPFDSTAQVESANFEVNMDTGLTLDLGITGTFDCTVDWGDGSVTNHKTGRVEHTYTSSGTYFVTVSGIVTVLTASSSPATLNDYLIKIHRFGSIGTGILRFGNCTKLTHVYGRINNSITQLNNLFAGCTSLVHYDYDIFFDCTEVTNFAAAFFGCSSLKKIQIATFEKNTKATSMVGVFEDSSVENIPDDLWNKCPLITTVSGAFTRTNVSVIPSGLLDNLTLLESVAALFESTNISVIPSGLFDNNTLITSFLSTFQINNISVIPSGLFDNNTLAENFTQTFRQTNITSIPTGLFNNNTAATSFEKTFKNTNITSVPFSLFVNNTLVTNFEGTFDGCSISAISNLFDNCTLVTTFKDCFKDNFTLTGIPNNLFINNILVTDYSGCFRQTGAIALPTTIFNLPALNINPNFTDFMYRSSTIDSPTGTIQNIWDFATGATSTNAFFNCTAITNYASIPVGWK